MNVRVAALLRGRVPEDLSCTFRFDIHEGYAAQPEGQIGRVLAALLGAQRYPAFSNIVCSTW